MTHKIHKHQQEIDEELRRHKRANFQRIRKLGQQFNYIAGPSQIYSSAAGGSAVDSAGGATPSDGGGAVGTSV